MDLTLFKKIMAEARHNKDLLDSVSPNQYRSKEVLIKHVENLQLVDQNSEIVIFGGWYGTILIPAFKYVDRITLIDKDKDIIGIAKNRLFDHYKNVDFISKDVFDWAPDSKRIKTCNLIINTSCEHMPSMKKLELDTKSYFAYQSNNMYDIEGHINCVSSMEEFKFQLPKNAKVMIEDKIIDERGTRFLLVGKYE
nr:methyltransferase type 11 [uncultured Mediterranean phage uvMED]|tara:strand:+ start:210 stop:794 length:585 start_codon:yes stop_codon:yes gene_type:complete